MKILVAKQRRPKLRYSEAWSSLKASPWPQCGSSTSWIIANSRKKNLVRTCGARISVKKFWNRDWLRLLQKSQNQDKCIRKGRQPRNTSWNYKLSFWYFCVRILAKQRIYVNESPIMSDLSLVDLLFLKVEWALFLICKMQFNELLWYFKIFLYQVPIIEYTILSFYCSCNRFLRSDKLCSRLFFVRKFKFLDLENFVKLRLHSS
mgnify:CR=1 FL=1